MTINQRIESIIYESGQSLSGFADEIGIKQQTLYNYIRNNREPSYSALQKIAQNCVGINIEWLITGKGSMLKSEQIESMKDRLAHFLEEEKIEIPDFCESIGMPQAYYLSMKGSIPESKLKNIIEKYPQLSIEWLMTGEGSMIKSTDSLVPSDDFESGTKPRIPYTAAAGSLTSAVDGVTAEQCEQIPRINAFPEYDFTIIIKGNSMEPKYEGGDEVACKKINEKSFIQWGKVHVLDTAQGIVIKRVYEDGEKIRCASYNPEYPDFSIPKDEIFSMSLIVGLIRL